MNTPRPGPKYSHARTVRTIDLSLLNLLGLGLLHTVHSSDGGNKTIAPTIWDPAGLGKTRGATWKYDSSDIKLGCRSRKKRF